MSADGNRPRSCVSEGHLSVPVAARHCPYATPGFAGQVLASEKIWACIAASAKLKAVSRLRLTCDPFVSVST
jgi:hypothetical protein